MALDNKNKVRINIPKEAETILNILQSKGFDAYVVGGCEFT